MNNVSVYNYFENIDVYFTPQEIEAEDLNAKFNRLFSKSFGIKPVDCNTDSWDMKTYYPKRKTYQKILFKQIPSYWKPILKRFAILLLANGKSVSTTNSCVGMINSVFHDSFEVSTVDTFSGYVEQNSLVEKLESMGTKSSYKQSLYYAVISLLKYLSVYYRLDFAVDFDYLFMRYKEHGTLSQRDKEKTPRVPPEYLEIIIDRFSDIARSFNYPVDDRTMAASMVLETQLGLRYEELLLLKPTDYREKKYGKTVFAYFEYDSIKASTDKNNPKRVKTSLNPLCIEMYHILLKLRKLIGVPDDYPYLIWLNIGMLENPKNPVIDMENFSFRIQKLFDTYLHEECRKPWPGIRQTHLKETKAPVYIPMLKSYRVSMCDYLFHLGLSPEIIRMKMGHISDKMDGYYARQDKDYQVERIEASSRFLKTLITENVTPIGLNSENLKKKLEHFINEKKINICDSEALENLEDEGLIIKSKHCGFCVRTGLSCKDDLRTNKILCALDECPNIYSFYYNIDSSLGAFEDAVRAAEENKKRGYEKAEVQEGKGAAWIVKNRITPQIRQLKEQIANHGEEEVLELHPELGKTIAELPEIEERIIEWKKKNMHYFC